jgi:hypothetical protein
LLLFFLLAEAFFRSFICSSDSFGITLSGKCWYQKHWHPKNELGYRDTDWNTKNVSDTRLIVTLGDSIASGIGVNRAEDRFTEQLRAILGEEYSSVLLAAPGWSTVDQLKALKKFPYTPDLVVFSYFINDIEDAYPGCGKEYSMTYTVPRQPFFWLVENSHFVNYLYWKFTRMLYSEYGLYYWNHQISAYNDPECWELHANQINELIDAASAINSKHMIAVLFPYFLDFNGSEPLLNKVEAVFSERNITVINLNQYLRNWNLEDLIVNPQDAHPTEEVHRLVAQKIAEQYSAL